VCIVLSLGTKATIHWVEGHKAGVGAEEQILIHRDEVKGGGGGGGRGIHMKQAHSEVP